MKHSLKKILTLFLVLTLLVAVSPASVFATENQDFSSIQDNENGTADTQNEGDTPQDSSSNETISGSLLSADADALPWPEGPSISAEAAVLVDVTTGTVLYEKNSDEQLYPASITKVMTMLLVIEKCSLNETVTFSHNAVYNLDPESSILGVSEGEQLSVEDSLYALFLKSANEVANGLAEHVAGSTEAFAEMMTERAKELGCTNTNFLNAHGLHEDEHYTSAADMAIIFAEAMKNDTFRRIASAASYTIEPTNKYAESRTIYMSHKMLLNSDYTYASAVAGKTGYTDQAGNTLVTYAEQGDLKLVAVVLKCPQTHYTDTIALFDYGFSNFTLYKTSSLDINYNNENIGFSSLLEKTFGDRAFTINSREDSYILLPNSIDVTQVHSELTYQTDKEDSDNTVAVISYYFYEVKIGETTLSITFEEETSADSQTETTGGSVYNKDPSVTNESAAGAAVSANLANKSDTLFISIWQILLVVLIALIIVGAVLAIMKLHDAKNHKITKSSSTSGSVISGKKSFWQKRKDKMGDE